MKKTKLIFFLLIFPFIVFCQPQISLDTVVQVNGISASDIYLRTISWVGTRFNNSESVLTSQNKDDWMLAGNVNFDHKLTGHRKIPFNYKFIIYIKDGKFKLKIDNIKNFYNFSAEYYIYNKQGERRRSYNFMYEDIQKNFQWFVSSLQKFIVENESKDW